jgi:N-acetylneuraminate lyase
MKRTQLGGVVPATITPFTADEKIDATAMRKLMQWNRGQGADSFFIGGSSAECFLLSPDERKEVFAIGAEMGGEAYLIAHVGAISTREAQDYARAAVKLGYDAIAATPPFYYGFGSKEICAYFYDLSQAAGMPVILYNFPGNTGKSIDLSDPNYVALFKSGTISGMKHTNQVVYQMERIKNLNPDLIIMNGYDETMVAGLALGANGSIGSTFNFMYPHYRQIMDLFCEKRLDEALALQIKANNIMNAICDVGLIPAIKHVLSTLGMDVGIPRRPFIPLTDAQKKLVDDAIAENLVI